MRANRVQRRPRRAWRACWLTGALVVACAASWAWGAERPLLIEKHKAAALACDACHKENPPRTAPPVATCTGCHGTYETIAEKTQNVTPHNPHQTHEGEIECWECHHVHKPSEDYCAKCHQFDFKVP